MLMNKIKRAENVWNSEDFRFSRPLKERRFVILLAYKNIIVKRWNRSYSQFDAFGLRASSKHSRIKRI